MASTSERIKSVSSKPFSDQRPGTSGLRKKTRVFLQPHYLENFVQAVFNVLREDLPEGLGAWTLVVGGDGRYHNRPAARIIVRMAVANGFGKVLVGRGAILSTPAMSAVIRRRKAVGGLLLSASHNPGGLDGDFGVKFNTSNGGPAPEAITSRIYDHACAISEYRIFHHEDVDIDRLGVSMLGETQVQVFDPLDDYTTVMEELFDFEALRGLFARGFRMVFDAMSAVTGPYARRILQERLGAPEDTIINGTPLEDFGGHHPDPNLAHAAELVRLLSGKSAPDFGAACDGDGDRNMILGRDFFVTPSDSLAIIAEHAEHCVPGYRNGLAGLARSMPTSSAADRVAAALEIPCYETPTGWKYFGNLMDAGLCSLCGEESFGTGSSHVREKDGIWAVLCWLSILAAKDRSVAEIVHDHWRRFGRSYYQRHDYEGLDAERASGMLTNLLERLPRLPGEKFGGSAVLRTDEFSYTDPVDGSVSSNQGIRIFLEDQSRVVCRLSGTGTHGATLRIYLERYRQDWNQNAERIIAPLAASVRQLLDLEKACGRTEPDVVT